MLRYVFREKQINKFTGYFSDFNFGQVGALSSCEDGQFTCLNSQCLNGTLVCNHRDSCGDGSDEIFCKNKTDTCWSWQTNCTGGKCEDGTFQCNNGKCIPLNVACDRIDNCGDGSDEIRNKKGFKCPFGGGGDVCVLPQRHVNDNFLHCSTNRDLCSEGENKCFTCFDQMFKISLTQQCDGIFDCSDLSDECPCEDNTHDVCLNICGLQGTKANCTKGTYSCDNQLTELRKMTICDGIADCADQSDEMSCGHKKRSHKKPVVITCPGNADGTEIIRAIMCDGLPECYDLADECNNTCKRPTLPPYCQLSRRLRRNFERYNLWQYECTSVSGNRRNHTVAELCNGIWSDCYPRLELEETNCSVRFYCQSHKLISLDRALVCDGYNQCDDGSDEASCDNRYTCDKGKPLSVPNRFVSDGIEDCKDGSDECPRSLDDKAVASRLEMISQPFFRVWIWVMAFVSLLGNSYVIVKTLRNVRNQRVGESRLSRCNNLLLFNLACSDFLMGIYLLSIAIQSSLYSGFYCKVHYKWLASTTCAALGALSTIATQTSVYTLAFITGLRMYSVFYPIKAKNIGLYCAIICAALSWTVALLFAIFPLVSYYRDQFTYGTWIPTKYFYSSSVNLTSVSNFASMFARLNPKAENITMENTWRFYESFFSFVHFPPLQTFGYYSYHSVCLPKYFVRKGDPIWMYSTAIILCNFVIFVFIAVSYILIYRKSTRKKIRSSAADRSSAMQRKIFFLVVTDFMCWIPICIIFLINFSQIAELGGILYGTTAIVLLPINSAINPLIYSNILVFVWNKLRRFRWWKTSLTNTKTTDQTETE